MSAGPNPNVTMEQIEQTRQQINRLVEEIARLSEMDLSPPDYYGEFLQRVLTAIAAPSGAIWLRTPQGHLQLQYQIRMAQIGLDKNEADRQSHDELLRQVAMAGRPWYMPPRSGTGTTEDGKPAPGNPTDYCILIAPILVDKQVAGLIEVWQDADRNPNAQRGFLQFMTRMADLASTYTRNHQLRSMIGQQQLWTQLEAFARQIHGSLKPMEVAYQVANEGRRLIDCDRVSVAQRMGKKAHVEAISGADVVEKRSNLVRLQAKLFNEVIRWGEKLVYRGEKDDSLPPAVGAALDNYLAESNSKLLVVNPLHDEREGEGEKRKKARSALMMECFDPSATPEQLIARLEVVGRHATSALYNAAEHKRIPMRFLWMPLAKLQEGLGGKARAITFGVLAGLALLTAALIWIPYPLKMDAKGQLLPKSRAVIYAPFPGHILNFRVNQGEKVKQDDILVEMFDLDLHKQMFELTSQIQGLQKEVDTIKEQLTKTSSEVEKARLNGDGLAKQAVIQHKTDVLNALVQRVNGVVEKPGFFSLKSPMDGTILNGDFQEQLTGRPVKPNEPLLRVGRKSGDWEIELKIPQKHIGQVMQAFNRNDPDKEELDVDLILLHAPTQTYKGKLKRGDVGGEAVPNQNDNNEPEPIVLAWIRIEGDDIPEADRLPRDLLMTGVEVKAKIRCGNYAMGYSLFYGVWEFLYEKVVFFF